MLFLVGTEPMQFAAVCADCGAREGPILGTRADAIEHLTRASWRVDERTRSTTCPACAGPPSVFPVASADVDAMRCSDCSAEVDACVVCSGPFTPDDVLSCRGALGHAHARCATQRLPKFVPPSG